jgi:succinyl-diaminopimelate desuccinylase
MAHLDVILLTQKLLSFNTINPPGNEDKITFYIGDILIENGFNVEYIRFEEGRYHLVAERGIFEEIPPIVFSGHFDTVPLGKQNWSADPFGGEINNGKLYGRGSSDMKGGLAAMIIAAIQAFEKDTPKSGIRLLFTAGEEKGCLGALHLINNYKKLGKAHCIIVGEPTANMPAIGHKGALYLNVSFSGKTAHSSMPHLGDNAIYKAARAIVKIETFDFKVEEDPILGLSTVNVGQVYGGLNINSVPDLAGFTIDCRTTTKVDHQMLLQQLRKEMGDVIIIEKLVDLNAITSNLNDPIVQNIYEICGIKHSTPEFLKIMPYLTDGSVLQPAYGGVPTIVLGPGQPEMAHQVNEFCSTEKLKEAVTIYKNIILNGKK